MITLSDPLRLLTQIENGMLLLDDKVDYLGGKVPGLFDHWEQQQGLARHIRYDSSVAAGRPPFVAFSKVRRR